MRRQLAPTEKELAVFFSRRENDLSPLYLRWEPLTKAKDDGYDGIVRVCWEKKKLRFGVEYKRLFSSKSLRQAIDQVQVASDRSGLRPMVMLPYLDRSALDELESRGVSGIDLCGNGVVVVPGELYFRRDGKPNQFKTEGTIKNVYRLASSVVARLFLVRPEFLSIQDALQEITRRGGHVTLSTVSKVCKVLESDLIVERSRDGATRLRLIQPNKLLDRLAENYTPPKVQRRVSGKYVGDSRSFYKAVREWTDGKTKLFGRTGATSVSLYAVMAREDQDEFYCSDIDSLERFLGKRFEESSRFATVTLLETSDETVFFDSQPDFAASPVQVFLELSNGDKRDRETAQDVRKVILKRLGSI